jgi:hypothetical protein
MPTSRASGWVASLPQTVVDHITPNVANDIGDRMILVPQEKSFHHSLRPLVEAGIAKIQSSKFLFRPLLCYLGHVPAEIPRVNVNSAKFTASFCNSLNVNGFFGPR